MSGLRSKAQEIFQKPPCAENDYVSFDEEAGCIVAFMRPGGTQGGVDARNAVLREYDDAIKEKFGKEHFHGEEGMPLAAPIREALWSVSHPYVEPES